MPKRSHIQAAIRGYTTEEDVRHAQYTKATPRDPDKATYNIRIKYVVPKSSLGLDEDASEGEVWRHLEGMRSADETYEMFGLELQRRDHDVKDVGDGEVEIEEESYIFLDDRERGSDHARPVSEMKKEVTDVIDRGGMSTYIIEDFRKAASGDWNRRAHVSPYLKRAADDCEDYLQDAEREQSIIPKMQVKLTEDVQAKERGGEYYILPEGEKLTILRSLDGTDRGRFEVEDDNGDRWIVPGKSLTKQGSREVAPKRP
jgi:hypothetical protein